jgi:hypothetical protein
MGIMVRKGKSKKRREGKKNKIRERDAEEE